MRVWLDTDLGSDVDDALTLGYLLRHPGFEVVGISTVFGDTPLRTRITEALLEKANAPDIPVLTGLGVPLSPDRPGVMFGHEGIGILPDPEPRMRVREEPEAETRVESLAAAVEAANAEAMIAIGPLTNLGALARRGVALPPLAIMGGKLRDVMLPGMIPQISEWNWYCDPVAVQCVLAARHSQLPRVVPAEVTFRTVLAETEVERLAGGDALAQALSALCTVWLRALRERLGATQPRVALHDPLTAATLAEPGLCRYEERAIRVDEAGAASAAAGPANVEAAVDVDNDALCSHLMDTWL